MATLLPLVPSIPSYRVSTTLEQDQYIFDLHWTEPAGWFIDALEVDGTPIFRCRLVLGTFLGRRVSHRLTRRGVLVPVDLSGEGREPGLDDLGTRVEVRYYPEDELAAEIIKMTRDGFRPSRSVVPG